MFLVDFRNMVVLVSLAVNLLLIWILYRYGRKSLSGKAYSVAILSLAGWIFPMALYRSQLFGETMLWVRSLYAMASFTSTSFFFFTLTFPADKKPKLRSEVILFLENILLILLCFHPSWLIRGVEMVPNREMAILWGPLYFVYSLHISGFILAGLVNLYLKSRKTSGETRKQCLYIMWGYFFAGNLAMATNLILPWFGYFELNWLGQFFSTFVAAFTTYAILKHKLLDIKVVATEGFILILNFFLFVQLLLSTDLRTFSTNAVIMIAVIVISYWVIRSVIQEVLRREETMKLAMSLEDANAKLKELDRQKTEFLSIASHQLRTPLSILKGYIELIEDGAYGKISKELVRVMKNIDESNERLITLVDEFLNVSRIEQGRVQYSFASCRINDVIQSTLDEFSGRAKKKGIKLEFIGKEKVFATLCDKEKVRLVFFNYIDNAIKYGNNTPIRVLIKEENKGVSVRVSDSGIGFSVEDGQQLFSRFYRSSNTDRVGEVGYGLGLFVCRKFIEAQGGRVWAKSAGIGKGSEFGFWLPFKKGRK